MPARLRAVLASALSLLLAVSIAFPLAAAPASALGDDEPATLGISKGVVPASPSILAAGETAHYRVQLTCSDVNGYGCRDAVMTDPLPQPLVLVPSSLTVTGSVPPSSITSSIASDGRTIRVAIADPFRDGTSGLAGGAQVDVEFDAVLPADVSADWNAVPIDNTATFTGSNVVTDVHDIATVLPGVQGTLLAGVTKSMEPASVSAVPGTAVAATLTAGNRSNQSVDTLTVQDPASDATSDPFAYLRLTGIDQLTPPSGATLVAADWLDGATGQWQTGSPVAIPTDPDTLLPSPLPDALAGVRFTFSAAGATLPPATSAEDGVVKLAFALRDAVEDLDASVSVVNDASAVVHKGVTASPVVHATAPLAIQRSSIAPLVTKAYGAAALVSGGSTTATIRAENSDFPVVSLTVDEPQSGTPDLAEQGLDFGGFVAADVEWPTGATHASVSYRYADSADTTAVSTTRDTLPTPAAGHRVTGFSVVFTGTMAPHEYAVLPFRVTSDVVPGTDQVTSVNTVEATAQRADGQKGDAQAAASILRRPIRVETSVGKTFTPDALWSVPGSTTLVQLPARVSPLDAATGTGSTAGAQLLQISDPADPAPGAIDPFWDAFDLRSIPATSIPSNATLDISWWNGSTWTAFSGAQGIAGPKTFSFTVPAALRESVRGVRFSFTPTQAGGVLQPGFTVSPNLNLTLRSTLRSDPGTPAVDSSADAASVFENTVRSTVANPNAVPSTAAADAADSITVTPIDGAGGAGIDLVDKQWITPNADSPLVNARTGDKATARVLWSTQGVAFDSVSIVDPTDAAADVATSVYDAFDVVRILPITPTLDAGIRFDRVAQVWRYSHAENDWVDITDEACSTTAACDGAFPGYTFTTAERADTLGVRLVFEESPTRAARIGAATDLAVGSGVASTTSRRGIDIEYSLRDALRSSGAAVLGTTHPYEFNSDAPGVVPNTVTAVGVLPGGGIITSSDRDDITVLDVPLNVTAAKSWAYGPLGVPPIGTPSTDYPVAVATVKATNTTAARVDQLSLVDAAAGSNTFDLLDLASIDAISVPGGATGSAVTLSYAAAPDASFTIAQARALAAADLADVTGITVTHTGRIDSGASTTAALSFRLRATHRSGGAPVTASLDAVDNRMTAIVRDAGGLASQNNVAAADAAAALSIEAPSYGVTAKKTIAPAERTEADANRSATVTLEAQPTGTVRTTSTVYTDATPTFWNAYDFTALSSLNLAGPITTVRVDALVGVSYALEDGALVASCDGDADLSDCWRNGQFASPASGSTTLQPHLPTGVVAADVRGLRFTFTRADGATWERPNNPKQAVSFTVQRRTTLLSNGQPVPSTLSTMTKAPGEPVLGVTTDTLDVVATGSWGNPSWNSPKWTAKASSTATVKLAHLSNGIRITKSPKGAVSPSQEVPFVITVKNTGAWPMTGLAIVDTIQSDADGPLLVFPTRTADDTTPVVEVALTNAQGAAQTAPVLTRTDSTDHGVLSFDVPDGFILTAGSTLTITLQLRMRVGLPAASTASNSVTATSDRVFDTCQGSVDTVLQAATSVVPDCSAITHVTSLAASPLSVVKGVRGVGAGAIGTDGDDLGVLAYSGAPSTEYCETPNAPDGFYRTPCVPITRPGGTEQWRTFITNSGNIRTTVVSAIDVLPANGDKGVIINQARSSRWAPTFTGDLEFGFPGTTQPTVTPYYLTAAPTTVCNRLDILRDTKGSISASDVQPSQYPGETTACLADVASRQWLAYDEAATPLAAVKALKFVITYPGSAGLGPQETLTISYTSTTAAYPERAEINDRDSIAWNSIAAGGRGVQTLPNGSEATSVTLVTEPRKAGVAMATGKLDLQKLVVAPGGFTQTPASYDFDLLCTSLGQDVPLRGIPDLNGTPIPLGTITLQADGTVLHVNDGTLIPSSRWSWLNLPLYADCSLREHSAQGATVSITPASVIAQRDFSGRTDVAGPVPSIETDDPDGVVPLARITATNTYHWAGFTVTKTVDAGGATTADGTPVAYEGPFGFETSCTFEGVTVLDDAFSIAAGETKSYDSLPAGADCLLSETDAGGAALAATTVTVTSDGEESASVGKTARFTLVANSGLTEGTIENAVEVTNTFDTRSLTVTKAITGAGGDVWGGSDFEADVLCTLDDATPTTVYAGTLTLGRDAGLTQTIDDIPLGADCSVTESATGAATAVSYSPIDGTVTLSDDATVTVTNRFDLGAVRVVKTLDGDPAAELPGATDYEYAFQLSCTRDVDGTTENLQLPDDGEFTITGAGSHDVTGLPVGASCSVAETDAGHSQAQSISAAVIVTADATNPVEIDVVNEFGTGSLAVHKSVSGAASAFAPDSFGATVACEWQGASVTLPDDGAITLVDGGTVVIDDLPIDAVCTVVEADSGQRLGVATVPDAAVIGASGPTDIAVSNIYDDAELIVTKTVRANDAAVPTDFGFSVDCTYLGDTVLDEDFSLDAGESRRFTDLPARALCTIVETDARGATSTITSGSSPDGTVVLDQDERTAVILDLTRTGRGDNTAGFENLFDTAGLLITKHLAGQAADLGQDRVFTAHVVCTFAGQTLFDGDIELSKSNGFSASVPAVVGGADCVVTEPDLGGADAVVITPNDGEDDTVGTFTIPASGVAEASITNWYLTGSLTVTKTFAGDGAARFGTEDYSIELGCTLDETPVAIAGGSQRIVSAAQPIATYTALPTGAVCALREADAGGASSSRVTDESGATLAESAASEHVFTVTTDAGQLTMEDQPQPGLDIENSFTLSSVSITKTVVDAALDQDGVAVSYGPFTVQLSCTLDGRPVEAAEPASRVIADGQTLVWTELPTGADCVVTETDSKGADWTTISAEQDSSQLEARADTLALAPLVVGDANAVSVVNSFDPIPIEIEKRLDGTAASTVAGTFPIRLLCVLTDASHPHGVTVWDRSYDVTAGEAVRAGVVAAGADCTVTELDARGASVTTVSVDDEQTTGRTARFSLPVSSDTGIRIVVTNTFDLPVPAITTGGLASTGVEGAPMLLAAAIALSVLGALLMVLSVGRRRRLVR